MTSASKVGSDKLSWAPSARFSYWHPQAPEPTSTLSQKGTESSIAEYLHWTSCISCQSSIIISIECQHIMCPSCLCPRLCWCFAKTTYIQAQCLHVHTLPYLHVGQHQETFLKIHRPLCKSCTKHAGTKRLQQITGSFNNNFQQFLKLKNQLHGPTVGHLYHVDALQRCTCTYNNVA